MKKIVSSIAALAAVAAVSISAFADGTYTIDYDTSTLWGYKDSMLSGADFSEITTDTVFTLTYEADKSLANVENHNYWCIKPMTRSAESGDYFIAGLEQFDGLTLSDSKDSYNIDTDAKSVSFKLAEADVENIKNGQAFFFMGHGVKLNTLTVSNSAATPSTPDNSGSGSNEPNVNTGVEGTAAVIGVAAIALGAVIVSRKRK